MSHLRRPLGAYPGHLRHLRDLRLVRHLRCKSRLDAFRPSSCGDWRAPNERVVPPSYKSSTYPSTNRHGCRGRVRARWTVLTPTRRQLRIRTVSMSYIPRLLSCMTWQGDFTAPMSDESGNHFIVTGASIGGIGFETALELYRRGGDVTLACRNDVKGKAAEDAIKAACPDSKGRLLTCNCDVSSLTSIRRFASEVVSLNRLPVDVLVANAGAIISSRSETPEGMEATFATCAGGHLLLNDLLKPNRMVFVTGDLYCMAPGTPADPKYPGSGIYAYANACLGRLMLARELRKRLENTDVIAVHPGVINSSLSTSLSIIKAIQSFIMLSPVQGAQASVYAATCPSDDIPAHTNYYHNKHGWLRLEETDLAMNDEGCASLLDECDKLCGIWRG